MIKIYGLRDWRQNLRYIGKTKRELQYRWGQHVRAARRGTKTAPVFDWIRSLSEPPTIELIAEVPDYCWQGAERYYIALARSLGCRLLNITEGGDGGATTPGRPMPAHVKEALRKSQVGRRMPAHVKEALRRAQRGRKASEETKKKMSLSQTGRTASNETRKKMAAAQRGKKHTPEAKEKMAAAKRGKKQTSEVIQKRFAWRSLQASL